MNTVQMSNVCLGMLVFLNKARFLLRIRDMIKKVLSWHSQHCGVCLCQGTLQKFVDDLFTAILTTNRPVPLAVKYFFDLLDEQALQYSITDPEIIHIWKTNR